MIRSFKDKRSEAIFNGQIARGLPAAIQQRARRKLRMLDAATCLQDMEVPPSNRLKKLQGAQAGRFSIRINDQWRICFTWQANHANDVEIIDYH
ncbi:MAG: type II toxin-antitoxin system RelE/ParE family toxin [Gammaproteobacteria bacterium]|nr:type II toxin-antitoxin system RelE/ParE family toxin [Gammaproteobacteria bacterium]MCY4322111.1 type II toxin-antitoxin system RelE/ParE family toxin [Gammaproteobacteria bacterium]